MASDWDVVKFKELYLIPSRNGLSKPKKVRGEGVKFINMGEIFKFDRMFNIPTDRVPVNKKEFDSSELRNNDLLFARQSLVLSGAGKCAIFLGDNEPVVFESHLIRVRPDEKKVYPEYLYYFFKSPQGRSEIWSITEQGAGQSGIRGSDLENINVPMPSHQEQKAIAHILGSLDNKIELNRQMNGTLEAMAQALFKSWFVDFDPVIDNALAAGNAIPDEFMERAEQRQAIEKKDNSDIQKLFPDAFEFTEEMGWIPKGWGIKKISDLVESVSITYPLKTVNEVIFLNTGDILAGKFLHKNYSDASSLPGQAKKSIKRDDILYSEIRPKNKRYAYVNFEADDYVVSTKLMVLRAVSSVKSLFSYFYLKQESVVLDLQYMAEDRSGTFPQITFDVLSQLTLTLPNETVLVDYFTDQILVPYHNKIYKNEESSENLAKLRDTLLPKLMSGELRIPDAAAFMDEVK